MFHTHCNSQCSYSIGMICFMVYLSCLRSIHEMFNGVFRIVQWNWTHQLTCPLCLMPRDSMRRRRQQHTTSYIGGSPTELGELRPARGKTASEHCFKKIFFYADRENLSSPAPPIHSGTVVHMRMIMIGAEDQTCALVQDK